MVKVKRLRADPYSLGPYLLRGRNCLTLRLGLWLIGLHTPWRLKICHEPLPQSPGP